MSHTPQLHPCHKSLNDSPFDCPDAHFKEGVLTNLAEMNMQLKLLYKAVEGNGQPGLRQRVESLEQFKATNQGGKEQRGEERSDKQVKIAVYSLVVSMMGVLVALGYHIVHTAAVMAEMGAKLAK